MVIERPKPGQVKHLSSAFISSDGTVFASRDEAVNYELAQRIETVVTNHITDGGKAKALIEDLIKNFSIGEKRVEDRSKDSD